MKLLANGCRCSEIGVIPKNWKTTTSTKKNWKVYYRFYAPGLTGSGTKYPKGKLITTNGMNEFKDIHDRKQVVKGIIEGIKHDLENKDYNPITGYRKNIFEVKNDDYEIHPETPVMEALDAAYEKKKVTAGAKKDLRSVLKYANIAAKNLKLHLIPVKDIRRRHMKILLDQIGKIKKEKWTANNHNFYRSHLMMLFDELCEWETIENNPMERVSKMKHTVKKRPTLSMEQRQLIDQGLRKENYRFWLLMNIFFLSGARETEMVLVKHEDVNIKEQTVKYTILKGTGYREEYRPIPNNAANLWQQALVGSRRGQYLFAKDLKPGDKPISAANAFTRRWETWVKKRTDEKGNPVYGENIADFYSLKHSHSTELSRKVGTKLAALHNQHTEAVLKENYDTEGQERHMEILKRIQVSFAPE